MKGSVGFVHVAAGWDYDTPQERATIVLWIWHWFFGISFGGRWWPPIDSLSNPFFELYFGIFSVEVYLDVTRSWEPA